MGVIDPTSYGSRTTTQPIVPGSSTQNSLDREPRSQIASRKGIPLVAPRSGGVSTLDPRPRSSTRTRIPGNYAPTLREQRQTPTARIYADGNLSGPSAYVARRTTPGYNRRCSITVGVHRSSPSATV